MNSRAIAITAVIIEVIALACFFYAVTQADRVMPKEGGGDSVAYELWNGRAGLAFGTLVGVWVAVLGSVLVNAARSRSLSILLQAQAYSSPLTAALALPIAGILFGYFALVVL